MHELLTNMALNKQQYEALPGKDGGERVMASEKPVVNQPTKLSATEEYVLNLDPATVAGKFAFDVLWFFWNELRFYLPHNLQISRPESGHKI